MKSMTYTVLQSYAYHDVLVMEYFYATTNFGIGTYARTGICGALPAKHLLKAVKYLRKNFHHSCFTGSYIYLCVRVQASINRADLI